MFYKFSSKKFFFFLSDGDETLGISGDSMDAGDKDGEPLREQVYITYIYINFLCMSRIFCLFVSYLYIPLCHLISNLITF